ncbi:hypothetical protein ACOMHN_001294 [Nucella lapillus]
MDSSVSCDVTCCVMDGGIESQIRGDLAYTVRNYTGNGNATIDFLQVKFHCCGSENYTDYQHSVWFLNQEELDKIYVPPTCCRGRGKDATSFEADDYQVCNLQAQALAPAWVTFTHLHPQVHPVSCDTSTLLHPQGCYRSLVEWLEDQSFTLIGVVVGIGVVEIFGIIFAVCLCRNRSEYYD